MKLSGFFHAIWLTGLILPITDPTFTSQAIGEPERLYAHQPAHIFFIVSMAATYSTILHYFLFTFLGGPYIEKFRGNKGYHVKNQLYTHRYHPDTV